MFDFISSLKIGEREKGKGKRGRDFHSLVVGIIVRGGFAP
jgi:hypothetical protein